MSLSLLALTDNRVHLAVAYAAAQEATLLARVLGGRSLLFAHTAEEARALAVRPDVGVLLVLGDEGRACELVSSVAAAEGPRPRVLFCAATPGERLIDLFHQGAVFRWARPPRVPRRARPRRRGGGAGVRLGGGARPADDRAGELAAAAPGPRADETRDRAPPLRRDGRIADPHPGAARWPRRPAAAVIGGGCRPLP